MARGIRIDRLFYELGAEVDDFQKGMANAEKSAMRFTSYVMKHPVAAVGALTAAMAALAVQSARMAAAVETNMRKVGSAIPAAQARIKDLTREVVELSKVTPRTAEELSSALAEIAKGTRDPDEAMKRLRASVVAADAANIDLTATFQGLDAILNAFNLSGRESEAILAKLFSVAQGKVPLDELLEVLTKNGAELTRMGFGLDEAAIRMVRLFEKGVPAKNIMTQFKEESKKATGATIDVTKALTDLNAAAQFTRDGTENLWKLMKNQFSAAMLELGTKVLPIVNAELKGFLGLVAQLDGTVANIKTDAAVQAINAIAKAWDKLSDESRVRDLKRLRDALEEIRKTTGFTAGSATQATEIRTKFSDEQLRAYLRALKVIRQAEGAGAVGGSLLADFEAEFNRRGLGLTTSTEARRATPPAAPTDPDVQKKRDAMIAEAQDALAQMSGSVAAIVDRELLKIAQRAREVFGDQVPAEIEAWMARIREEFATNETFEGLKGEFESLRQASEEGADALRGGYAGAIAEATEKLRGLSGRVQSELQATTLTVDERKRLKVLLDEIQQRLDKNASLAGQAAKHAGEESKSREEILKNAAEMGRKIEMAARGALQLAEAFGLVDERSSKVLQNAIQLGAALPLALKGDKTGILGALGAGVSFLGSLFGESPEEKARKQILEANTEALRRLGQQIGEFGLDITGKDFTKVSSAATAALNAGQLAQDNAIKAYQQWMKHTWMPQPQLPGVAASNAIRGSILGAGFSLQEFSDLARDLGIAFAGTIPTLKELQQVSEAIASIELTKFAETFTGQLQSLRAEFELFDITDPIEQLKKLVALFDNPNFGAPALRRALAGIDLTSPEGRAAAKQAVQTLFEQMQAGTLAPEGLGALTAEQFLEQLLEVNRLLGGAGQAQGETRQFGVERKITEVQADRLIALETTGLAILEAQLVAQESIRDYLAAIAVGGIGLQPPPLSSLARMGTGVGAPVNVEFAAEAIVINVGAGTDPNSIAQMLAGTLGDLIVTAIESRTRHQDAAQGTPLMS